MDTKQARVIKPPRRMRTVAERRSIVEETLQPGASVAIVARHHEVNANLVFTWRRQYRQGLLEPNAAITATRLLPVQINAPRAAPIRDAAGSGTITITLMSGHRIELHAPIDVCSLAPVLDLLLQRC